jgi:hypothetical protein
MPRLFHYTKTRYLVPIVLEGIRPAESGCRPPERPVAWLTYSEEYEPTALIGVISGEGRRRLEAGLSLRDSDLRTLTFEEQAADPDVGAARVEVDEQAAPLTWWTWLKQSGVRKREARILRRIAERRGSDVNLWRASFETIPQGAIVGADIWHEGDWLRVADRDEGDLRVAVGEPSPFRPAKVEQQP